MSSSLDLSNLCLNKIPLLLLTHHPGLRCCGYLVDKYIHTPPIGPPKTDIISKFPKIPHSSRQYYIQHTISSITHQNFPIASKEPPNWKPKIFERVAQSWEATTHSKKKVVAYFRFIAKKRQLKSNNFLLLLRFSLVRTLFLVSNQRKYCTLGGFSISQIEEMKTRCIPLKFMTLYRDCTE